MAVRKIIFFYLLHWARSFLNTDLVPISITRQHKGDVFYAAGEKCYKELCIGLSSGTAEMNENKDCKCKCDQRFPVYRDDLNICVDDIQECSLVPFVSGSTVKKIPYVFLPLKGQIVYPSAEIVISDIGKPVCVVSGGQFLRKNGWMNLKNSSGNEIPFRLFRDEGRTYLQWFGEPSLRMAMEGRIILVHLLCKDGVATEEPRIFTPCIAFRIAGSPVLEVGTREVLFATEVHLEEEFNAGLSIREYVAIGLCSLFLAVVYVASVFLYLNWRKRKNKNSIKEAGEEAQLTLGEEGIIKNNPLLQTDQHLGVCREDNNGYISDSNSCCSETEQASDLMGLDEDDLEVHQNMQTSALIHPCEIEYTESILNQDPNSIERLPEENVSIVETVEGKEIHPEAIKAITSTNGRRKLYFNPSYFDPDLLKAPPPAALEFLQKIREVIAIAKRKMSTKKFFPSLLGIPEEDGSLTTESDNKRVKSKNIENEDLKKNGNSESNESSELPICLSEVNKLCTPLDVKQRIIQKWLENVPIIISDENESKSLDLGIRNFREKKIISKTPSRQWKEVEKDKITKIKETVEISKIPKLHEKKKPTKSRPPPPPLLPHSTLDSLNENSRNTIEEVENSKIIEQKQSQNEMELANKTNSKSQYKPVSISNCDRVVTPKSFFPPSPPPLPTNKHKDETICSPTKDFMSSNVSKNLMDAVIQELSGFNKNEKVKSKLFNTQDFENHTKEKNLRVKNKIFDDIINEKLQRNSSSDEEKSNKKSEKTSVQQTINLNCSEITLKDKHTKCQLNDSAESLQDGHEYETILLNPDLLPSPKVKKNKPTDLNLYNLPEFFSKNDKHEGYSLVSEVYVNDECSFCSGDSPSSSYSNSSLEPEKKNVEVLDNKSGRLTIQVKSSIQQKQNYTSESDSFEPDTLERKQNKSKLIQKINEKNEDGDTYSDQRLKNEQENKAESNENFTDSLERPTIMLKTNGSFKRNFCEKDIDEIFKNLNWTRKDSFGSLREIYEAKSKNYKRRTETTSLVDFTNNDIDCISTSSWGEERRNKLLHRGIILHINDSGSKKHKKILQHCDSKKVRSVEIQKSGTDFEPGSTSPVLNSLCILSTSKSTKALTQNLPIPLRNYSPPLPPPRSISTFPQVTHLQAPPPNSSPDVGEKNLLNKKHCPQSLTPSSIKNQKCKTQNHSNSPIKLSPTFPVPVFQELPPPPRPPKIIIDKSPPLPPRTIKPPLPPKNPKKIGRKTNSRKFATRPLPPLPISKTNEQSSLSCPNYKDSETLSTISGTSMDSLNSFEYESFYTTPYEEEFRYTCEKDESGTDNNTTKTIHNLNDSTTNILDISSDIPIFSMSNNTLAKETLIQERKKKIESKSWDNLTNVTPKKIDDSEYLSTDSNESYYPKIILSSQISKISEKAESLGSQNSETEESFCDGGSESGAESIATDSFFYGNFKKECFQNCLENYADISTHQQSPKGKPIHADSNIQIHC